ncbi:MAG: hypothetical protein ACLUQW_02980 [Collinsella sp.]
MSWSIRAFDSSEKVGHIVVVCPAERRAEMRRLAISPFDTNIPISFADAGDTCQIHRASAQLGGSNTSPPTASSVPITTEAIDQLSTCLWVIARRCRLRTARDRHAQDR